MGKCFMCGKKWNIQSLCFTCMRKNSKSDQTKKQRKKELKKANKFKMMTEDGIGSERDPIEIELDRMIDEEDNRKTN